MSYPSMYDVPPRILLSKTGSQRGILAADESNGTMGKRLEPLGLPNIPGVRQDYREMLISAPGLEKYIGGIILFDETARAYYSGLTVPEYLNYRGILPGIKVDQGLEPIAGLDSRFRRTRGLDTLQQRLDEYASMGMVFAKWRAYIPVLPSSPDFRTAVRVVAQELGIYAARCQEAGLVPIIEPEVEMDGKFTFDQSQEANLFTWQTVFEQMDALEVDLKEAMLKPSFITDGVESVVPNDIGSMTMDTMLYGVPRHIGGVVFLSGGLSPLQATACLNEVNDYAPMLPWDASLSFSYGRALQAPVLRAWNGKPENVEAAQQVLVHRARMNCLACEGVWCYEAEELNREYDPFEVMRAR